MEGVLCVADDMILYGEGETQEVAIVHEPHRKWVPKRWPNFTLIFEKIYVSNYWFDVITLHN